jgi:hypothetical protein
VCVPAHDQVNVPIVIGIIEDKTYPAYGQVRSLGALSSPFF